MKYCGKQGFSLIGLAAVTVVVTLFAMVLFPALVGSVSCCDLAVVGCRGRDIYVSIVGANSERAAVGLAPVWPADRGFYSNSVVDEIASTVFTNSTDFFRKLYDEPNAGTDKWSPYVAGFDYSKLAGGGVSVCETGKLTPKHNMWTIAKNVSEEADDILPVLVTRNVDATSLAARYDLIDGDKQVRFDPHWNTPFGDKSLCLIRKGGAIFKARAKYSSYKVVYNDVIFNTPARKVESADPLRWKYLTPTGEVVPGEETYRLGALNQRIEVHLIWRKLRTQMMDMGKVILGIGSVIGAIYLAIGFVFLVYQFVRRKRPQFSQLFVLTCLIHCLIVTLYAVLLVSLCKEQALFGWLILAVALALQTGGILYIRKRVINDPARLQRYIKGLVAAPLMLCNPLLLGLLILAIYSTLPILLPVLGILLISVLVLVVTWRK